MSQRTAATPRDRLLDAGLALVRDLDEQIVFDRLLESARQMTGARYAALGILNERRTGLRRFLTSGVDDATHQAIGELPSGRGVLGALFARPQPLRLGDIAQHPSSYGFPAGHPAMRSFLGVPVSIRGEHWGSLYLAERAHGGFTREDEMAAVVLADWAGVAIENARAYETSKRRREELEESLRGAVALAQGVQTERLRSSLATAAAERARWARELHDQTLQGLAALRLLLSAALRREDRDSDRPAMREAVEQIEHEIENLRAIIAELRPPALEELGLHAAIEALLERHRHGSGLDAQSELVLPRRREAADPNRRDLDTIVYRLVQEALTNVAKHASARSVRVAIRDSDGELQIEVQDDGAGFDVGAASRGFGLVGMRERVALAGGTMSIESGEHGTLLTASLPAVGEPQDARI